MRKLFPTHPPGKCLPTTLQKCLLPEAPAGEAVTRPAVRRMCDHGDTLKSSARPSPCQSPQRGERGAVSSGSFACATTFLPKVRALGKSGLPTNPLRADSHLSAMWRESSSPELRMLQSTEIPQWTTQVYSGRVFVTPAVNKKIPSLSANLATQVRESHEKLMRR